MTIITKGMGAIIKGGRKKLSVSQKAKASAAKDKAISKIVSGKRKLYRKKFGKEPTFKMKNPLTGKTRRDVVLVKGPVTGFNVDPKMPKAGKKGQGKLFTETRKKPKEFKQLELPLKRTFGPRKKRKVK